MNTFGQTGVSFRLKQRRRTISEEQCVSQPDPVNTGHTPSQHLFPDARIANKHHWYDSLSGCKAHLNGCSLSINKHQFLEICAQKSIISFSRRNKYVARWTIRLQNEQRSYGEQCSYNIITVELRLLDENYIKGLTLFEWFTDNPSGIQLMFLHSFVFVSRCERKRTKPNTNTNNLYSCVASTVNLSNVFYLNDK